MKSQRKRRRLLLLACLAYATIGSECDSDNGDLLSDPEDRDGTISGTVVFGVADSPIGGAEVTLTGPGRTGTAISGADGTFRFAFLPPGSYSLVATISGSTESTCESVSANVKAGQTVTAIISCTLPAGTLTVTARVGQQTLQDAQVVIIGPHTTRAGRTEAGGVARFEDVPAGSYNITAVRTGHHCPSASGRVVAEQATNVSIDCIAQPGSIRGQVTVDGSGGAFVQVTYSSPVSVLGGTLTDDSRGDYQFRNVAPGVYTVSILTPRGATCDVTDIEATVQRSQDAIVNFGCTATSGEGTIAGSVMAGGSPISGATVRVIPWWDTGAVTTGANGTFTFAGPAGAITVAAFALGFDCQPVSVNLQANEVVTANIQCRSATGIAGRIAGSTLDLFFHGPFSGSLPLILRGPVERPAFADPGSQFVFEDLPTGHYIVGRAPPNVFGEFCVPVPAIAIVQAGATTTVDLYCTFDF